MRISVRQAQLRWFAVRRLLTSCALSLAGLGLAVIIVWTDYQMAFFALVSALGGLIAGAYGAQMLKLAASATDMTAEVEEDTITYTVNTSTQTQTTTGIWACPTYLAVYAPKTGFFFFPIGKAGMDRAVAELEERNFAFERKSGWVGTVLPLLGFAAVAVVGVVLTRLIVYGTFFAVAEISLRWPIFATVLILTLAALAVGSVAWRAITALANRQTSDTAD